MEQTVTIKCQIIPESIFAEQALQLSMEQYRLACNAVSKYMFDHDFIMSQSKLNHALYHYLRDTFGLKAQMAQSAIRNVVARYRTVKTQLASKLYRYPTGKMDDDGYQIWDSAKRTLDWLWYPIELKRPQLDLQRTRDWSIKSNHVMSLNTVHGRIKAKYICHGFDQYLDGTWQFGIAKILYVNQRWYMHISATKVLSDYDLSATRHVVGVDRGLRFLATVYDEQGQTKFFSGQKIIRQRRKYKRLRQQLQHKGTKSAKRRLKRIGQRENRWMRDVNHQLSKTLVNQYGSHTLFVLDRKSVV